MCVTNMSDLRSMKYEHYLQLCNFCIINRFFLQCIFPKNKIFSSMMKMLWSSLFSLMKHSVVH